MSLLATVGLIRLILPRRYEVWLDRLPLVFPIGSSSIPFETIETMREGHLYDAYAFIGIRFATAPGQAVTILRHNANLLRRPNVVISPEDRESFLYRLQEVMAGTPHPPTPSPTSERGRHISGVAEPDSPVFFVLAL